MARKYIRYEVATEIAEMVCFDYKDAFRQYQTCGCSATLYGVDEMGEFTVIMSK